MKHSSTITEGTTFKVTKCGLGSAGRNFLYREGVVTGFKKIGTLELVMFDIASDGIGVHVTMSSCASMSKFIANVELK